MRKSSLAWFVVLAATGLVVYAAGLHGFYFMDDYQVVFDLTPHVSAGSFLFGNPPENHFAFYRPLESAFLLLSQRTFGLNPLPVHIVQVALHATLAWMVFVILSGLGFSSLQARLGSLVMLVSQANAHAVLSNDTLSQVGCTLFGYLSIWLLHLFLEGDGKQKGLYALSLASMALACLFKEVGVSFFLMATFLVGVRALRKGGTASIVRGMWIILPFALVVGVYWVIRSHSVVMQPRMGSEGYALAFGLNIPKNVALLLFASLVPVSSVATFAALKAGPHLVFFSAVGAALLVLLLTLTGLALSRERRGLLMMLGALCLAATVPMIFVNHISELHAYNCMPLVAAFCGIGIGRCLELSRGKRIVWAGAAAVVMLQLAGNAIAVQAKAHQMAANGEKSASMLEQITPFLKDVPPNGNLLLVNTPLAEKETEYSVFLVHGLRVLQFGEHRLNQIAKKEGLRGDFSTTFMDAADFSGKTRNDFPEGCCLALTLDPESGRVVKLSSPN
jgi:hypothetical protein